MRQVQVHQYFRAVRGRKELILYKRHADDRQHKHQHRRANGPPAIAHAPQQTGVEGMGQAPRFFGLGFDLGAEDVHAQNGGEQDRHHPGDQHRYGNHGEQSKGVLTRRAVVEADGHKAGHRDQGAGEHRKRRGMVGEGRGLFLGFAQFEPCDHHFYRDHRVIHQQAEGDDQCTQ